MLNLIGSQKILTRRGCVLIYSWKTSSGDDVELVLTDHGEQLYIEKVLYRDREYTADFVMRSGSISSG